ncbi:MAG: exonuclease domain-containing protein [Armatimonadetes bacterium]|nr:exonuclease domain-containing protein [Armatimonadota bacterium]
MIKRADKILVYDLELTCWDGGIPPPGNVSEVIQFGWCFLDPRSGERFGRDSLYVRPAQSEISAYCTRLTGITPKILKQGQPLQTTCARLVKSGTKQYVSAAYGDDRSCLYTECEYANAEFPLSDESIDVATLVKLALNRYKSVGLVEACSTFGVSWEGEQHRADWDAWNTAGLLAALLQGGWRNIVP